MILKKIMIKEEFGPHHPFSYKTWNILGVEKKDGEPVNSHIIAHQILLLL